MFQISQRKKDEHTPQYYTVEEGKIRKTNEAFPGQSQKNKPIERSDATPPEMIPQQVENETQNEPPLDEKKPLLRFLQIGMLGIALIILILGWRTLAPTAFSAFHALQAPPDISTPGNQGIPDIAPAPSRDPLQTQDIVQIVAILNTSFITLQEGVRGDVIAYTQAHDSLYAFKTKLNGRISVLKANKMLFEAQFNKMSDADLLPLYEAITTRFDVLEATLNTLNKTTYKPDAISIFNEYLSVDGEALNSATDILKSALDEAQIPYSIQDGTLVLEY